MSSSNAPGGGCALAEPAIASAKKECQSDTIERCLCLQAVGDNLAA
jgi:hypothetical protein